MEFVARRYCKDYSRGEQNTFEDTEWRKTNWIGHTIRTKRNIINRDCRWEKKDRKEKAQDHK